MASRDSAYTSVHACPSCARLDVAHVGDTETSRWLECRRCGQVWSHKLPASTATEFDGWRADHRGAHSGQGTGSARRTSR